MVILTMLIMFVWLALIFGVVAVVIISRVCLFKDLDKWFGQDRKYMDHVVLGKNKHSGQYITRKQILKCCIGWYSKDDLQKHYEGRKVIK